MKKSELKALIKETVSEMSQENPSGVVSAVLYEVELDHPDFFVSFEGPNNLTQDQILNRAIEEMTQKTSIFKVVKKPI